MGYNTTFNGKLKFNEDLTGSQLAILRGYLGEDVREHTEWGCKYDIYYIDVVMLDDFSGVEWDSETEKTYGMVNIINFLSDEIRKFIPDFRFVGELIAQGEDFDDRWKLLIDDSGKAYKKEIIMDGKKVVCPHCEESFILE